MLRLPLPVLLALLIAVPGCGDSGPPMYDVSGTVKLDGGTPVQTGTVEFSSADGSHSARGAIDKEGRFSFATVPGEHKGVVIQLILTEDLPAHEHDHGPTVHPDFAHYRRSGLSFDVTPEGPNEFDIVVKAVEQKSH